MSKKRDALGDRMKSFYEDRTRYYIPRKVFGLIRIDGKAFHTFTKKLEKPFDIGLISDLNETAQYLCENIQGARFGFVQSDEIQIVFTDLFDRNSEMWFDGNIQKIASVSASLATSKFNQLRIKRYLAKKFFQARDAEEVDFNTGHWVSECPLGQFDSRVWSVSTIEEAINSFIWRQQDAIRNSVSMIAQFFCSHKELHGKNQSQMIDMIKAKNFDFDNYNIGHKRGRMIVKKEKMVEISQQAFDKSNASQRDSMFFSNGKYYTKRSVWVVENAFDFTHYLGQEQLKLILLHGKDFQLVNE